ncbi:MAG: hypothetical protein ABIY52_18480 [Gemmatimonadaceae bacterium]
MTPSHVVIAAIFLASAVGHFVFPRAFMSIMPSWLPSHRMLVYVSGAFEALGGIGILLPATRAAAGWGLIALLVAVFPANIQMLLNAHSAHASRAYQSALVARLPLQPLLIWWIYLTTVRAGA